MDSLKDWFLASAWTLTAIPNKVKKWADSQVGPLRDALPSIVNELVSQSWTVFGLLVGWIVLPDGETRDFVGVVLFWLVIAWVVTMPLRLKRD
jgi:hypothetical protein